MTLADIKPPDQTVFDAKAMADHLAGQQIAPQITGKASQGEGGEQAGARTGWR